MADFKLSLNHCVLIISFVALPFIALSVQANDDFSQEDFISFVTHKLTDSYFLVKNSSNWTFTSEVCPRARSHRHSSGSKICTVSASTTLVRCTAWQVFRTHLAGCRESLRQKLPITDVRLLCCNDSSRRILPWLVPVDIR